MCFTMLRPGGGEGGDGEGIVFILSDDDESKQNVSLFLRAATLTLLVISATSDWGIKYKMLKVK